eukprot:m.200493 g.200493  ORF g.200493 m.200493 type:complete len:271 (-) comp25943_c0_seq5:21-833(-)
MSLFVFLYVFFNACVVVCALVNYNANGTQFSVLSSSSSPSPIIQGSWRFRAFNQWHSPETVQLISNKELKGCDSAGCYKGMSFSYAMKSKPTHQFSVLYQNYGTRNASVLTLQFSNVTMSGMASNLRASAGASTQFPVFDLSTLLDPFGYLSWSGTMCPHSSGSNFSGSVVQKVGTDGGPIVLFREFDSETMIVSPFNNFMTATQTYNATDNSWAVGEWERAGLRNLACFSLGSFLLLLPIYFFEKNDARTKYLFFLAEIYYRELILKQF